MVVVGWHPRIRLAMVCGSKRLGGVSNYIYINLGTALNLTSMEDNKNSIAICWQEQPPLKQVLSLIFK